MVIKMVLSKSTGNSSRNIRQSAPSYVAMPRSWELFRNLEV